MDEIDNFISGFKSKVNSLQLEMKGNRKDSNEKLHTYDDSLEVMEKNMIGIEKKKIYSNKVVIYQLEKMRSEMR